jgi:transcriptional regulator with XRE-family HTH domain
MSNLPTGWAAYARIQQRLSSLSTVDDQAWGLEGALDTVLEPDFSPENTSSGDFCRAAATASRKARDRQARFTGELEEGEEAADVLDLLTQVEARQALRAIENGIDRQEDLSMLWALAQGYGYAYLQALLGQPQASLRSRSLRLRRRFAHLKPTN